jgi:hypothetical protein
MAARISALRASISAAASRPLDDDDDDDDDDPYSSLSLPIARTLATTSSRRAAPRRTHSPNNLPPLPRRLAVSRRRAEARARTRALAAAAVVDETITVDILHARTDGRMNERNG